jgi:CDP-glycerol glycerophosphotransferase
MPGPHLRTSAQVVEAIAEVDAHHAAYAPTYQRFVEDFCAWDDGRAAQRFVDRVFGDHL